MITISQGNLFQMPAGEWHINGGNLLGQQVAYVQGARADDLMGLCIWADAVHRDGGTPSAIIPYLPGARQDRRQGGEALSCKVYADLINSCNLAKVVCCDPHSDVMPALINNCVIVPLTRILAKKAVFEFQQYGAFIIPDVGAAKRVDQVARFFKKPTFQAMKHRDMDTGKLSGFSCPKISPPGTRSWVIIDDMCDGGGTFMGLAQHLYDTQGIGPEQLDLWVTHGIFSGDNAENLHKHFGKIMSTDSYQPSAPTARYNHKFTAKWTEFSIFDILRECV